MIGDDLDKTWNELEAARRQTESRLSTWAEMRGRYHGSAWDSSEQSYSKELESPEYEIIATMKAQFLAGDPMCTAKPMRVDRPEARLKAIALRHTINRLSRDADHKTFFGKQFVDWCLAYDVVGVQRTPAPWADSGPVDGPVRRPRFFRISPGRYRVDPRATEQEEERWRGFVLVTSLAKIKTQSKTEKGWHSDALSKLQPESGDVTTMFPVEGRNLQRDDVKLYVCWCPEEQMRKEPGFNGSIRMYAETGKDKGPLALVYGPVGYYGPRRGPFYKSGQEHVPDSTHPLSVMQQIQNLARPLGLQSNVVDNAIRSYARFYIDGSGQQGVAGKVKNAGHNGVVAVPGWRKEMGAMFEKGGLNAEMLAAYQFFLERLDRRAGLSSTARGQAQSGTTATAEAIAQGGSAARMEGLRDTWHKHVRECQRALGEILCMDEQFWMPLPPEAVAEMMQAGVPPDEDGQIKIPTDVQGGYGKDESFEDYEIDIEPMSMRFQSQEEREMAAEREMAIWGWAAQVTGTPTSAALDIKGILGDIGEKIGQPELPERFNAPLAEQIAGVMLMGAIQQGSGAFESGSQPKPQAGSSPRQVDVTAISAQPAKPQPAAGGASKAGAKTGGAAGGMAKKAVGAAK
jgi:hypothetical protein